jgi:hypothetical protein
MLLYIKNHFHPDLIDGDNDAAISDGAEKLIEPYFLSDKLHPATAIPWDDPEPLAFRKHKQLVVNELSGLFGRFRDKTDIEPFSDNPIGLAESVIVMDMDYLTRPGGRGGDNNSLMVRVSPYTRDAHASLFIKYGIIGDSTGTREFDSIFSAIASDEVIRELDRPAIRQLQTVIAIYVAHHPEMITHERLMHINSLIKELNDGK